MKHSKKHIPILAVVLTALMFLPYTLNAVHILVHDYHLENVDALTDENNTLDCNWDEIQIAPAILLGFVEPQPLTTSEFAPISTRINKFYGAPDSTYFSLRAPPTRM